MGRDRSACSALFKLVSFCKIGLAPAAGSYRSRTPNPPPSFQSPFLEFGNPDWSSDRPDPGSSVAPWRVYNIGNNDPVDVPKVISILEQKLGRVAKKEMLQMQPSDVPATYADVEDLMREVDFRPATPIEEGISRFVD